MVPRHVRVSSFCMLIEIAACGCGGGGGHKLGGLPSGTGGTGAGTTVATGAGGATIGMGGTTGTGGGLTVTYDPNGATGAAPVDATRYADGQTVTVLGNTGNLAYSGYTFVGWQTKADGSGTTYAPGKHLHDGRGRRHPVRAVGRRVCVRGEPQ